VLFAMLVGAAVAAAELWRRRSAGPSPTMPSTPTSAPTPPPTQRAAATPTPTPEPAPEREATAEPEASPTRWVAPIDGQCPDGYPVKANDNSGIYHVVGGRFYARTVPERCYATAEDAEADGYRRAKA